MSQARGFEAIRSKMSLAKELINAHGFTGDSSVWVDLLQHLEDVDGIRFLPLLAVHGGK